MTFEEQIALESIANARKQIKAEEKRLALLDARWHGRRAGFVYFCKTPQAYKIGRSKNPEARIASLQANPNERWSLVHKIRTDDMYELERCAHGAFSTWPHRRIRGEWFIIDEDDIVWRGWLSGDELFFVEDYEMERSLLVGNIQAYEELIRSGGVKPRPLAERFAKYEKVT